MKKYFLSLFILICLSSLIVAGTYESVTFTTEEEAAVLQIANNAQPAQLDDDATLTSTATNNIIEARPITSMEQLAAVSYVGTSALTDLKNYVPTWLAENSGGSDPEPEPDPEPTSDPDAQLMAFVNHSSVTAAELDAIAYVTTTAAGNIVNARPIADIATLDAISYVSTTAIDRMRTYAESWVNPDGGSTPDPEPEPEPEPEPSTEDAKLVEFINHSSVTAAELDAIAYVTTDAANKIIEVRATSPINSAAELDAVTYVSSTAVERIRTYAESWVNPDAAPEPDPEPTGGGTYDDVVFTEAEEATALEIANTAYSYQFDAGGVSATARNTLLANRPFDNLAAVAATSGIATSTMNALKGMVASWTGAIAPISSVSVQTLLNEGTTNGENSAYFGKTVIVPRAIITSAPYTSSTGNVSFWIADPFAGNVQQLKVYIPSATASQLDLGFASLFDDVKLVGKFTVYGSTWEVVVDDVNAVPDAHNVTKNANGLKYSDYAKLLDAWNSTSDHPEGDVLMESTYGYWYHVPMPVFKDNPDFANWETTMNNAINND